MKKIITANDIVYGPYDEVTVLADRYQVDGGAELPFVVIGESIVSEVPDDYVRPMTPEEQAEQEQREIEAKAAFNESQKQKREAAYKAESDPINFMYQRGEATQQEWLDKVAEIKARFPYQE
jgi:hypothetical protein